jgi:hypothetical protein
MSTTHLLASLSQGIVLPALSRRTGAPCRAIATRQFVLVKDKDSQIRLAGCLDHRGRVFRTAVRDIVAIQAPLLVHAMTLPDDAPIPVALAALPRASFNYDALGSPFTFCSLGTRYATEHIGGGPSPNGDVTAKMFSVCGMLIPTAGPLSPPVRQMGHLWPHGDFARPSGSHIISFVSQPGFLFAAKYPLELAAKLIMRNSKAWGEEWIPAEVAEQTKEFAAKVAEQYRPRTYVPLTADMLDRAAKRPPIDARSLWASGHLAPRQAARIVWRNGRTPSGAPIPLDDPALNQFFQRFRDQ